MSELSLSDQLDRMELEDIEEEVHFNPHTRNTTNTTRTAHVNETSPETSKKVFHHKHHKRNHDEMRPINSNHGHINQIVPYSGQLRQSPVDPNMQDGLDYLASIDAE